MLLPSELLQALPGAKRMEEDWVLVSYVAGDRVEWAAEEQIILELRDDSVLQAVGKLGRLPEGNRLAIKRGDQLIWEGSP